MGRFLCHQEKGNKLSALLKVEWELKKDALAAVADHGMITLGNISLSKSQRREVQGLTALGLRESLARVPKIFSVGRLQRRIALGLSALYASSMMFVTCPRRVIIELSSVSFRSFTLYFEVKLFLFPGPWLNF
jgi:hypothetical protein